MGSIGHPSEEDDLNFPNLPPFPSDVPTVPLLRISLARLLAKDPEEEEKLWRACCDLGFFYLDLRNAHGQDIDGEELLESAEECFNLANEVFDLPVEEKMKYDMMAEGKRSYFGYKGFGKGVVDGKGNRDRNEFWNISKDDVLGVGEALPHPEVLKREESRAMLGRYMRRSYGVVELILGVLNGRLGLAEGTLQNLHRLNAVSGDQVRWVKSPPQPMDDRQAALGAHTDFGSVTVLFNRLGGLQVLPPDADEFAYVKPLKGHCVVNLGDAMVKFTAGILRSNIHRVVNPPGQQQDETRYSLVYFNRPGDEVILKTLEGSEMIKTKWEQEGDMDDAGDELTAKEWILRRATAIRGGGKFKGTEGNRLDKVERKRDSGVEAR